jgi:hypothetical protein
MGSWPILADGLLARSNPDLAGSLAAVAFDPTPTPNRFNARNGLLDEGIPEFRARSYLARIEHTFGSFSKWRKSHHDYLAAEVLLRAPLGWRFDTLDPGDPRTCAETFRSSDAYRDANDEMLVRIEDADEIARKAADAGADLEMILEWARVVAGGHKRGIARRNLDEALYRWRTKLTLGPWRATFWKDVADLLPDSEAAAPSEWPYKLYSRLGLGSLAATPKRCIRLLVFRYPVADLPAPATATGKRPLVRRTLLDGRLEPWFCPAPREKPDGGSVDLEANIRPTARDVVHPPFDLDARYLFRVAEMEPPAPPDLGFARSIFITQLQDECGRADYAALTDEDIL